MCLIDWTNRSTPAIQKSLHKIRIDGLPLLGVGVSGIVYALEQSSVVRIFSQSDNEFCHEESMRYLEVEKRM
jgi:hypothetical protein